MCFFVFFGGYVRVSFVRSWFRADLDLGGDCSMILNPKARGATLSPSPPRFPSAVNLSDSRERSGAGCGVRGGPWSGLTVDRLENADPPAAARPVAARLLAPA